MSSLSVQVVSPPIVRVTSPTTDSVIYTPSGSTFTTHSGINLLLLYEEISPSLLEKIMASLEPAPLVSRHKSQQATRVEVFNVL